MKKGCFIKAVIIVTILVAAAIYIIQYKADDWFIKPAKKLLLNEIINEWEHELRYVEESAQKDSLRTLMIYYIENIKSMEDIVNLDEEIFLKEFNLVVEDSIISSEEISKLTLLLKKEPNEKFKNSRN
jgi:hypothetical protein